MTLSVDVVLLLIAAVCFALGALRIGPPQVSLSNLGLLAWVLTLLV